MNKQEIILILNQLGKLVPNSKDFTKTELWNYVIDTLRERGLTTR